MASESTTHERITLAAIRIASDQFTSDSESVGVEGIGDDAVGLPDARLGGTRLDEVAWVGQSEPTSADGTCLPAGRKAARTIRAHLWGIINAVVLRTTNAVAESMNSKIQRIKRRACGYRNRPRFRHAILFHLGGLDLYPPQLTHTKR